MLLKNMGGEPLRLTPEAVARAEARTDISHPLIDILDRNTQKIVGLNNMWGSLATPREQHDFISGEYHFLADAVIQNGSYSLEPTEALAVWSKAREVLPLPHRSRFATLVATNLALQDATIPDLRDLSYVIWNAQATPKALRDYPDQLKETGRGLAELRELYETVRTYGLGTTKTPGELRDLGLNAHVDRNAAEELRQIHEHVRIHSSPLVKDFVDMLGGSLRNLEARIALAIDQTVNPSPESFSSDDEALRTEASDALFSVISQDKNALLLQRFADAYGHFRRFIPAESYDFKTNTVVESRKRKSERDKIEYHGFLYGLRAAMSRLPEYYKSLQEDPDDFLEYMEMFEEGGWESKIDDGSYWEIMDLAKIVFDEDTTLAVFRDGVRLQKKTGSTFHTDAHIHSALRMYWLDGISSAASSMG